MIYYPYRLKELFFIQVAGEMLSYFAHSIFMRSYMGGEPPCPTGIKQYSHYLYEVLHGRGTALSRWNKTMHHHRYEVLHEQKITL